MKSLLLILFLGISCVAISQDTTDVYVVNNTNKLVSIIDSSGTVSYGYFYRNLGKISTTEFIEFENGKALEDFFNTCLRSLDKDLLLMARGYSISRNKLSKNVVKVRKKDGGYFLLKRETMNNIQDAYSRSLEKE